MPGTLSMRCSRNPDGAGPASCCPPAGLVRTIVLAPVSRLAGLYERAFNVLALNAAESLSIIEAGLGLIGSSIAANRRMQRLKPARSFYIITNRLRLIIRCFVMNFSIFAMGNYFDC